MSIGSFPSGGAAPMVQPPQVNMDFLRPVVRQDITGQGSQDLNRIMQPQTGGQGFTPPSTWQKVTGSSSPLSMDLIDQYVDPATGMRYKMDGSPMNSYNQSPFAKFESPGTPFLPQGQERVAENAPTQANPGQYPNLMQNPAFNPAAQTPAPAPIPTPPTVAQQIASPAPGAQQLISQLTPPAPRPALQQPPQMAAPLPTPAPVTQQPFSYAAPQLKFAPPPRVDMDFLRQPGAAPQPAVTPPAPFSPPPRVDMEFLRQPGLTPPPPVQAPFSPPPRVDMDFLRAPAPQVKPNPFAPAIKPVAQPRPAPAPAPVPRMPTQATQGYVSRVPARGAGIAPPAPAPKPVPKAAPKPVARPTPFKPVAKAAPKPVRR
jgi:hypothetical protein